MVEFNLTGLDRNKMSPVTILADANIFQKTVERQTGNPTLIVPMELLIVKVQSDIHNIKLIERADHEVA